MVCIDKTAYLGRYAAGTYLCMHYRIKMLISQSPWVNLEIFKLIEVDEH